jgi:AcrR family transcriptional regulator
MGTQERRERERGKVRSLIMDTARKLFAAEGYEAVSMRRIADAIEYSPTAIYVYFRDKDALIRDLCREDFGRLAAISNRLAEISDPIERIRQLGHAYVRFAVKHPNHYRLMFMTPDKNVELDHADLDRRGNPDVDGYAFLLHAVREAFDAGRFLPELKSPELIAQIFWAVPHGVASLQIAKAGDGWVEWKPLEQRTALAIDAILRGMVTSDKKRGGK